jgi:hypothetical protein
VVVCAHLAALDRSRFLTRLAELPDLLMDQVGYGLSVVLDLT